MSKKHDFLRSEQFRDQHPERDLVGYLAAAARAATTQDGSASSYGGKVTNEHNKTGDKAPTQTDQGRHPPQSRHDRQTLGAGPQNQVSACKGGGGDGRTPRGAG